MVPALPGLARHIGTDGELLAQLVLVTPAIAIAICGVAAQALVFRWGLRKCLFAALLVYAAAGVAGMCAPTLATLIVSRLVLGAAGGISATLGLAAAADLPQPLRGRIIGISSATGSLLSLLALSIGGLLVDAFDWRAPMWMYMISLALLIPVLLGIQNDTHTPAEQRFPFLDSPAMKLWPFFGLMAWECMAIFAVDIQGPFLLVQAGVGDAKTIGLVTAGYALTGAISGVSYGWFREHLGEYRTLFLAPILLGTGLLAIGLCEGGHRIAVVMLMAGFGAGWVCPALFSAVLERTAPGYRVLAMGSVYGAIYIGLFINPLLLVHIRLAAGISNTFIAVGMTMIGTGLLIKLIRRSPGF